MAAFDFKHVIVGFHALFTQLGFQIHGVPAATHMKREERMCCPRPSCLFEACEWELLENAGCEQGAGRVQGGRGQGAGRT